MTVREAITQTDGLKPNKYSIEDKLRWLSEVEYSIFDDLVKRYKSPFPFPIPFEIPKPFKPFTEEDMEKELYAPFPFSNIYPAYLKMKIDEENQETDRYNASATLYNYYYDEYAKHINKTRRPKGKNAFRIY